MAKKLRFRTIILSDVHLGTRDCKIREVNHFLKAIHCERLILNGDIIDGWQLLRRGQWSMNHTRFVRLILKKVEKEETEVIYLRGNHDGILSRFLPLHFEGISVREDYLWETQAGRYLVLHGDILDGVTHHRPVLTRLGEMGGQLLLRINRACNVWRSWRGKEPHSMSKQSKARVKHAVNFVSSFERELATIASSRGCQGVVCGHIHVPADKNLGRIRYLNCGDWVESLSAVVEHLDGRVELLTYEDFRRRLGHSDLVEWRGTGARTWWNPQRTSSEPNRLTFPEAQPRHRDFSPED